MTTLGNNGDVTWTPAVVWPPNHKLVPIRFSWQETPDAADALGGENTLTVDNITSTGVDDKGAGQPSAKQGPDYTGVGNSGSAPNGEEVNVTAWVRSERSGTDKAGRVYTVELSCDSPDDGDGNATALITVPHDMGNHNGTSAKARRLHVTIKR
jgi:hypothetical protein